MKEAESCRGVMVFCVKCQIKKIYNIITTQDRNLWQWQVSSKVRRNVVLEHQIGDLIKWNPMQVFKSGRYLKVLRCEPNLPIICHSGELTFVTKAAHGSVKGSPWPTLLLDGHVPQKPCPNSCHHNSPLYITNKSISFPWHCVPLAWSENATSS